MVEVSIVKTGVTQYIVNRTENENSQWFEFPAAEGRKGDNGEIDNVFSVWI